MKYFFVISCLTFQQEKEFESKIEELRAEIQGKNERIDGMHNEEEELKEVRYRFY